MITAINCIPHFEIRITFYRTTENEGQQNNEFFCSGQRFSDRNLIN